MPLILRALATSGQLSLALIYQAASSLFGILRTAIQHNPAQTEGVEDAENATTTETDGGASPTDDASHPSEEQRSGSSSASSDSSDSDYDPDSDSSETEASLNEVVFETHLQDHEEQPEAAEPEQNAGEPIDSASSTRSTRPRPASVQGTSRATRRASNHPYRYSAAPFTRGTANLSEHLDNSPVRHHREFLRAGTHTPSPTPSRPVTPTLPHALSPQTNAVASGSRPAKRSRESDADDSSASEAELAEPPRTRRRRSMSRPHPECTRSECAFASGLRRLDNGFSARRAMMDEEDSWSTAAQASDTDPDPNDAVFENTKGNSDSDSDAT
ncbi:hypothetical protein TRAPUB_12663 [Trametes pubescens]|uniref:Uncharacterized protein n=1 Tax=Trametes pubescens TaxID=154538 RepID=A0A1M2VT70_TRAPU|nr:hypothetical protein TRAPUB_12663 [Trametes pubescens]